jgi:hypothetical protein
MVFLDDLMKELAASDWKCRGLAAASRNLSVDVS